MLIFKKKAVRRGKRYPVAFYIGGDRFSGAEKRMLLTASKLAEKSNKESFVVIRKNLHDQIEKNHNFSLGVGNVKLKSIKCYEADNFLEKLFIQARCVLVLIFLFHNKSQIHVSLFARPEFIAFTFLKVFFGKKVYYEITSPDVAKSTWTKLLIKSKFLYSKLIAVSQTVEKILIAQGVNSGLYTRSAPYFEPSQKFDSFNKRNKVLYAHRLVERKNPMIAAEAFANLAVKYPDWDFEIYGDGPLSDEVSKVAKGSGAKNFAYKGYSNDTGDLFSKSKVFVSLIEPDNYPSQSVIEALSLGNFLVFSDVGSSRFYFNDEVASTPVSLSSASVERAISDFIEDPDAHPTVSDVARKFVGSKFSVSTYLKDSELIYESRC